MSTTLLQTASKTATDSLLHQNSSSGAATSQSYNFSFASYLRQNSLAALASEIPVCPAFISGHCPLGRRCPDRHPTPTQQPQHHYGRGNDNFVCKHWLKGLCKKGDACDYLHEYNLRKMSECQFFNQNGYCQNGDECLYVHVKEDSKLPLCEDYSSGFCKLGPRCGKRHVRRKLCEFYLAGFCPEGKGCKHGVHLKAENAKEMDNDEEKRRVNRVDEPEKRDDDSKREFGWRGGRGGRGGRWKNKRERRGGN